jgi:Fe-S-cluster-containing hydrogenase component 2
VWPCVVSCEKEALSFFYGNIMVDTEKCAGCASYTAGTLPACIDGCGNAEVKTVIKARTAAQKRIDAVNALP